MNTPVRATVPRAAFELRQQQIAEDFFVYQADFSALAPNTPQTATINIQADSHFKWVMATYDADIAAAAFTEANAPVPNVTVQITDTGSGRNLFSSAVPVPSIFGRGQLPFVLPLPRIFAARSSISITAANYDAAETYNLKLSLVGMKLFDIGGSVP